MISPGSELEIFIANKPLSVDGDWESSTHRTRSFETVVGYLLQGRMSVSVTHSKWRLKVRFVSSPNFL